VGAALPPLRLPGPLIKMAVMQKVTMRPVEAAADIAMMAASPATTNSDRLYVGSGNLGIFYQNVHGLRTKSTEIFNNVCSFDYKIICLTEMWLNESFSTHNFFPETYTVFVPVEIATTSCVVEAF
jgi:hypothetical protein